MFSDALKDEPEGGDSMAVCIRLVLEAVLHGQVDRTGFLAPEACIEGQPYIASSNGLSLFSLGRLRLVRHLWLLAVYELQPKAES